MGNDRDITDERFNDRHFRLNREPIDFQKAIQKTKNLSMIGLHEELFSSLESIENFNDSCSELVFVLQCRA